jgi:hypothetical protein
MEEGTFEEVGGFDPDLSHCADWELVNRSVSSL